MDMHSWLASSGVESKEQYEFIHKRVSMLCFVIFFL